MRERSGAVKIAVEDLGTHADTLEAELSGGAHIFLVRAGHVFAEIRSAALRENVSQAEAPRYIPDFHAQMREVWGDRVLNVDTTEWVREDRDGRE